MSVKDMIHRIADLEAELTTATHALSIAVERVRVLEGALRGIVEDHIFTSWEGIYGDRGGVYAQTAREALEKKQ